MHIIMEHVVKRQEVDERVASGMRIETYLCGHCHRHVLFPRLCLDGDGVRQDTAGREQRHKVATCHSGLDWVKRIV